MKTTFNLSSLYNSQKKTFLKWGLFILSVVYLTACGAVTPYPIPTPTITPTGTPAWVVQNNNDCFIALEFTPGKSTMKDMKMSWGEPSYSDESYEDSASWHYDTFLNFVVRFEKEIVDEIVLYPKNCTLGDVIATLGPPDVVEIISLTSCIDLSKTFNIRFHYLNRGFYFVKSCPFGSVEEECQSFRPDDKIGWKEYYSTEEESEAIFYFDSTITEWVGFFP